MTNCSIVPMHRFCVAGAKLEARHSGGTQQCDTFLSVSHSFIYVFNVNDFPVGTWPHNNILWPLTAASNACFCSKVSIYWFVNSHVQFTFDNKTGNVSRNFSANENRCNETNKLTRRDLEVARLSKSLVSTFRKKIDLIF